MIIEKKYFFGLGCKILSLICFCLLSLTVQGVQSPLNSVEQFGILCVIGALILLPLILLKFKKELSTSKVGLYWVRALVSIGGMISWMEAVKDVGAGNAILVIYITPICSIFLAGLVREEKIRYACLLGGLVCYLVIVSTLSVKVEFSVYGFLMASVSSVMWATYEIICKKQTYNEHFFVQVFNTFLFAALLLAPFCMKTLISLPLSDFLPLMGMALLRVMNVVFLFLALKWASINWIAPISYLKFPIMALMTFILLGETHSLTHWGTALLLVSINVMVGKQSLLHARLKSSISIPADSA
jgi:drug/metabolite transporter (DMT)-like permease